MALDQRGTIKGAPSTSKGALPKGHHQRGTAKGTPSKGAPRIRGAPPKRHYPRVTKKKSYFKKYELAAARNW